MVLFVLIVRTITAKTSKAMAINFVLAQAVGLVALVIFSISGLGPSPEEWRHAQSRAPKPEEMLKAIPWEFFIAGAIWLLGGNYIVLRQRRKAGESWIQALNPFGPLVRYMDGRSWWQLLLLVFLTLAVAQIGLTRRVPHLPQDPTPTQSRPQ